MLYYFRDYSIGKDTYAYVEYFEVLKYIDYSEIYYYSQLFKVEFFFFLFSKFLLEVFQDIHVVFYIYAVITYTILLYAFRKSKLNFLLLLFSIFTFFPIYYYGFNILRQSISLSFIILSIMYLVRGENKKFVLWVILAGLFHSSAIICLFFYFIFFFREYLYKNIILFYSVFYTIGYVFFSFIGSYLDKYTVYIEGDDAKPFGWLILLFFAFNFFFAYFLDRSKNLGLYREELKFYNIILGLFLVYNLLLNTIGFSNQGLNRLGFYLMWPIIFIIPILVYTQFKGNDKVLVNLGVFIFYFLICLYLLANQSESIVPFKFW